MQNLNDVLSQYPGNNDILTYIIIKILQRLVHPDNPKNVPILTANVEQGEIQPEVEVDWVEVNTYFLNNFKMIIPPQRVARGGSSRKPKVHTGEKGGQYIVDTNGKKKYVRKKKQKA
jgi:hypothetical protein